MKFILGYILAGAGLMLGHGWGLYYWANDSIIMVSRIEFSIALILGGGLIMLTNRYPLK